MNKIDTIATEVLLLEAERQLDLQKQRITRLRTLGYVLVKMCKDHENQQILEEIRKELNEERCF